MPLVPNRVLVTGSLDWTDFECISDTLFRYRPTILGHGAARGADRLAGQWASKHGVPVQEYPANWNAHKKAAGFIRNQEMLDHFQPHLVIAFKDRFDRTLAAGGTEDMVRRAQESCYEVVIIDRYDGPGLFDS